MPLKHGILTYSLLVLVIFVLSCGGKDVKPVSDEAKITEEAISLLETIREAYIKDNRETLEMTSTKEGYRELIGALKRFDRAELTFTPTWIEIEDSRISLTVSWRGTWTVDRRKNEERGVAIFLLEGKPLKLSQVLRENPFKQPE